MYKKIIFIISICFGIALKAQVPVADNSLEIQAFPKETTHLEINSNLLLAGEPLLYKGYCLTSSKTASALSKILYVSLRDQNDSVIFTHKLKVENGQSQGSYFIPANLKTGVYTLLAYTNFSRNSPLDAMSQKQLYVINSFVKQEFLNKTGNEEVSEIGISSGKKEIPLMQPQIATNGISVKTNKASYNAREKISLKIENPSGNVGFGNYSLSVRKTDEIEIGGEKVQNARNPANESETFYLPELRGEIVSRKILSLNENIPMANKVAALTIPGETPVFKLSKTNENGQFFFSIDEPYQTTTGILQIAGPDREQYSIRLDEKKINSKKTVPSVLKLDPNIAPWLEQRSIYLQIENAYFDVKKDSILLRKSAEPFYANLGTEYKLDDYTRFPTVRETFVEIIKLAAIRREGEGHRFIIFDAYDPEGLSTFGKLPTLLLMDGILIQNNEEVLDYNAGNIQSIRVINEPYRYGLNIYSGIIAIKTKKGDFKPNLKTGHSEEFEMQMLQPIKKYYTPDYSEITLNRIPDYRVQLLWEPSFVLDSKTGSKDFYASDVPGIYEIVLQGFSHEGTYVSAKGYFRVE